MSLEKEDPENNGIVVKFVFCLKRWDESSTTCSGDDDGSFMICCDKCENWYHGNCIEIDEKESKKMNNFVCSVCESKGLGKTLYKPGSTRGSRSNPQIQLTEEQKSILIEQQAKIEEERKKAKEISEQEKKKIDDEEKKRLEEEKKRLEEEENKKSEELVEKRSKIVRQFCESLSKPIGDKGLNNLLFTPNEAAELIEKALFQYCKGYGSKEYTQKCRTIAFNLGDKKKS